MPLLLSVENKQTRNSLLHVGCVSNPPWRDEQFRPWDGKPLNQNQSLQERRINLTLFLSDDDRAFPLRRVTLDKHLTHPVMAMQFHKFSAASGSFLNHANMQRLFALT